MKKFILIVLVVVFNFSMVFSQGCLPEGITFETQEEIDNFQANNPGCVEIEGFVIISGSDNITNLNGLNGLTSIEGKLWIYSCKVLNSLSGLQNITIIDGDLEVYFWPSSTSILSDLKGLDSLTTIGGGLNILNTDVLSSLTGLENVNSIGGSLEVAGNASLLNFSGLDNLTSIGNEIRIGENASLIDLTGLGNLTSVGGNIEIYDDNLNSLAGLDNLTTVGGALKINYNTSLSSIAGLANLTSIGGYIEIYYNDALNSLEGLENIETGSITDLYVEYNSSLSSCDVNSVCEYLASPNGDIDISNNAPGCNSQQEVEDACSALSVSEILAEPEFELFPNPAINELYIIVKNGAIVNEVTIYNQLGQTILFKKHISSKIDVSGLRKGLNVFEIVTDEMLCRKKILIE